MRHLDVMLLRSFHDMIWNMLRDTEEVQNLVTAEVSCTLKIKGLLREQHEGNFVSQSSRHYQQHRCSALHYCTIICCLVSLTSQAFLRWPTKESRRCRAVATSSDERDELTEGL